MTPDAYLEIRFKTPDEGGRKTTVMGEFYACPLFVEGEGFDCRLLIKEMKWELGKVYKVPVKFLDRDSVLPKLCVGKTVTLWEGKDVATGKVISILQ